MAPPLLTRPAVVLPGPDRVGLILSAPTAAPGGGRRRLRQNPVMTAAPVTVRSATEADLPAIKDIYDAEVQDGISTFALTAPELCHWSERLHSGTPGDHLVVAEADCGVLGYAFSGPYRPREAYARTREASVYLTRAARGRGIGRLLYDELLGRLRSDGMRLVVAVVALPNDASRALHLGRGFDSVGVLHDVGHKHGRWIDTELFELRLR